LPAPAVTGLLFCVVLFTASAHSGVCRRSFSFPFSDLCACCILPTAPRRPLPPASAAQYYKIRRIRHVLCYHFRRYGPSSLSFSALVETHHADMAPLFSVSTFHSPKTYFVSTKLGGIPNRLFRLLLPAVTVGFFAEMYERARARKPLCIKGLRALFLQLFLAVIQQCQQFPTGANTKLLINPLHMDLLSELSNRERIKKIAPKRINQIC